MQFVQFVHRPSNCYPLIGNCCHVRPVLPTGHPAVFFLNKGKGIGSLICRASPEDAADPVPPPPIPLGHRAGGIQGGPPPCAGGPGTRRFLAYLCLLSLREKVGRGAGRSARSGECRGGTPRIVGGWDCRPAKNSPGCRAERLHREVLGPPPPQNPSEEAERKKGGAGAASWGCSPRIKKTSCLLPQNIV